MGQAKKIMKPNNETDDSSSKSRREVIYSLEMYNDPSQDIGTNNENFLLQLFSTSNIFKNLTIVGLSKD